MYDIPFRHVIKLTMYFPSLLKRYQNEICVYHHPRSNIVTQDPNFFVNLHGNANDMNLQF